MLQNIPLNLLAIIYIFYFIFSPKGTEPKILVWILIVSSFIKINSIVSVYGPNKDKNLTSYGLSYSIDFRIPFKYLLYQNTKKIFFLNLYFNSFIIMTKVVNKSSYNSLAKRLISVLSIRLLGTTPM